LAVGSNDGEILIAWQNPKPDGGRNSFGVRLGPDGVLLDQKPQLISTEPIYTGGGLSIIGRDNEFLLVWGNTAFWYSFRNDQISAARFNSNGVALDLEPVRIGASARPARYPALLTNENGYTVFYETSDLRNISRIRSKSVDLRSPGTWRNED